MYGETDGETCYNLEGEPVTGDVATNLMLESIAEGENGGVGWPYKDCQDVTADVIEWVMHEVGERMGFTGRNNTFRGAGHNGKTLSEKIGIFDAWSLAVLPEGVLDSLMVGSDAAADDSGAPGMLDDSALSMLTAAAAAGMQQKGAGRGGQGGQAQPSKRSHAEDVSRGSAKRATTKRNCSGSTPASTSACCKRAMEFAFCFRFSRLNLDSRNDPRQRPFRPAGTASLAPRPHRLDRTASPTRTQAPILRFPSHRINFIEGQSLQRQARPAAERMAARLLAVA
eukprot:COSAG06_NODE_633_length_13595_cov_70.292531_4_plen_283_part_00